MGKSALRIGLLSKQLLVDSTEVRIVKRNYKVASYASSSDSEAAETEVEYDLEVEGSSNPSEHETSDDEPRSAYAYGSSALQKV